MGIMAEFRSMVTGRCPFADECRNYTQDTYTCDCSHDEYDHRCYKEKVSKR